MRKEGIYTLFETLSLILGRITITSFILMLTGGGRIMIWFTSWFTWGDFAYIIAYMRG